MNDLIFAVYKKNHNDDEPRHVIRAYSSIELAEKQVKKIIYQLTNDLLPTHNIYSEYCTIGNSKEYKISSIPNNVLVRYPKLECTLIIQPYSIQKEDQDEPEEQDEPDTEEEQVEEETKEEQVEEQEELTDLVEQVHVDHNTLCIDDREEEKKSSYSLSSFFGRV